LAEADQVASCARQIAVGDSLSKDLADEQPVAHVLAEDEDLRSTLSAIGVFRSPAAKGAVLPPGPNKAPASAHGALVSSKWANHAAARESGASGEGVRPKDAADGGREPVVGAKRVLREKIAGARCTTARPAVPRDRAHWCRRPREQRKQGVQLLLAPPSRAEERAASARQRTSNTLGNRECLATRPPRPVERRSVRPC